VLITFSKKLMSKKTSGKKKSQPRTRSKASRKGKENTVKGRIAEEITARMYDAPLRNVKRNAALPPVNRDSKLTRDIDVLLSSPIVSRRAERSAIECKNRSCLKRDAVKDLNAARRV
jgi:hypothetical protein